MEGGREGAREQGSQQGDSQRPWASRGPALTEALGTTGSRFHRGPGCHRVPLSQRPWAPQGPSLTAKNRVIDVVKTNSLGSACILSLRHILSHV